MIKPLAILLLLCSPAWAGWPDPRVVRLEGGYSGSFASVNGKTVIITCAHITADTHETVGKTINFECNDGSRGTATISAIATPFNTAGDPIVDCAILTLTGTLDKSVRPLRFSEAPLRAGETVWVSGFPVTNSFQYCCRTMTVASDGPTLVLNGRSAPGDSGAPIINANGELVGTLTALTSEGQTLCCSREVETKFCLASVNQCGGCSGSDCEIYYQPRPAPRPSPRPQGPPTYSPAPRPTPQPIAQQQPAAPAFDWDEYDKRQAKLLEAIAANKCDCKPTDLQPVLNKLDIVLAAVSVKPAPTPPTPQPTAEQHVVIVADHNAPYWQRLAEAIAHTKKTYSGVQDTTLPQFAIGLHPKAVIYRNSVPVRIVSGEKDVLDLLYRLGRGEPV